jgi:hypothetical protein
MPEGDRAVAAVITEGIAVAPCLVSGDDGELSVWKVAGAAPRCQGETAGSDLAEVRAEHVLLTVGTRAAEGSV